MAKEKRDSTTSDSEKLKNRPNSSNKRTTLTSTRYRSLLNGRHLKDFIPDTTFRDSTFSGSQRPPLSENSLSQAKQLCASNSKSEHGLPPSSPQRIENNVQSLLQPGPSEQQEVAPSDIPRKSNSKAELCLQGQKEMEEVHHGPLSEQRVLTVEIFLKESEGRDKENPDKEICSEPQGLEEEEEEDELEEGEFRVSPGRRRHFQNRISQENESKVEESWIMEIPDTGLVSTVIHGSKDREHQNSAPNNQSFGLYQEPLAIGQESLAISGAQNENGIESRQETAGPFAHLVPVTPKPHAVMTSEVQGNNQMSPLRLFINNIPETTPRRVPSTDTGNHFLTQREPSTPVPFVASRPNPSPVPIRSTAPRPALPPAPARSHHSSSAPSLNNVVRPDARLGLPPFVMLQSRSEPRAPAPHLRHSLKPIGKKSDHTWGNWLGKEK